MALTAKQEVFCQGVAVRKLSQTDAYTYAYDVGKMTPASIHNAASKLAAIDEVKARIVVLTERATAAAVKAGALTLAQSIDEAGQMFEDAKALGQVAAGVAAAKLRAQLSGHLDEKKQDAKGSLDDMDVKGLLAMREAVEAKITSSREALEMVGDVVAPAAPIRRVI